MHGLRYLDGPLYALTSALQCFTAACETQNETRVQAAAGAFDV